MTREVIYESDEIYVYFIEGSRNKSAVVTFSSLKERIKGFGEEFFYKNRIPAVHFVAKHDDWYQNGSSDAACVAARAYLDRLGFGQVMTYGTSMGAYGAARSSSRLEADRCLLLAPQWSANPATAPHDRRWKGQAKSIRFIHDDMAKHISKTANKWIVADMASQDADHARLYADIPNTKIINLPAAGHFIPEFLLRCGALRDTVMGAYEGDLFAQKILARTRPVRGSLANYWHNLSVIAERTEARIEEALKKRKKKSSRPTIRSVAYAQKACEMAPNVERYRHRLTSLLLEKGQLAEAMRMLGEDATKNPYDIRIWRGLSRAYSKLGHPEKAVLFARFALSLSPTNPDLTRVLARSLYAANQRDEATALLRDLIKSNPDDAGSKKLIDSFKP